jgi:hypothetical protein
MMSVVLPPETSVLWVDAPHTRTICSNHGSAPPKCRHSWSAAASEVLQSRCAGRGLPSGPRLSVRVVPTPAVPCVRGGGMTRSRIQKLQPTSIWITILVPGSLWTFLAYGVRTFLSNKYPMSIFTRDRGIHYVSSSHYGLYGWFS